MRLRSLLFVPGDSARKIDRALQSKADALILDLEDAVVPSRKSFAREFVSERLADRGEYSGQLYVRINPLSSGLALDDLARVVRPGLDGVLVPKADGAEDIVRVGHYLDALEQAHGLVREGVRIGVVATETPAAMFNLRSYLPPPERLSWFTWGAEDLSAAIGAESNLNTDGNWTEPYRMARAQCLFAAAGAGLPAVDTLYSDFRDLDGLSRDCARARRDGFSGRIAIHPDQVETINRSFSPDGAGIQAALRIVAAFEAQPDAGVLSIDGKMLDLPHLKAARRMLVNAGDI